MDEEATAFRGKLMGVQAGLVKAVAMQDDVSTMITHRPNLDLGRGLRHHNDGVDALLLGAEGDALRMISGGGSDHAGIPLLGRQASKFVDRAANLEGKDGLQILPLDVDLVSKGLAEKVHMVDRGLDRRVIDPPIEDLLYIFKL